MTTINQFLDDYRQKVDFYEKLAQICAHQCESGLKRNGIRALVTYRAKRLDSLMEKVTNRSQTKKYASIDDIYEDIVDLSGVRIALYFPGDRDEVDALLRSNFNIELCKNFPEELDYDYPYQKRFAGYSARHYRLRLKKHTLTEPEQDYANQIIEVQLGSVLMHSWAEVEHDLVYKSHPTPLSYDEYAILDELNGLMHAGEVALERLQSAVKRRINTESRPFTNHYELASFLYDHLRMRSTNDTEPHIGRADVLFRFLQIIKLDTVAKLMPFLNKCNTNTSRRPIAEQIVDKIIAEREDYYEAYNRARQEIGRIDPFGTPQEAFSYFSDKMGLGLFMRQWIAVENQLGEILGNVLLNQLNNIGSLEDIRNEIDTETLIQLEKVRNLRDRILYGNDWPAEHELAEAGYILQKISKQLKSKSPALKETLNSKLVDPDKDHSPPPEAQECI